MLDLMRKHASSMFIKVVLGAIIITFIFFFGYSSYTKGQKGGRGGNTGKMVARVNGMPITDAEFESIFKRYYEQIKSSFKDKEVPEFAKKMAMSGALQQVVGREVALTQADELGIVVPDGELAAVIQKAVAGQTGGTFDPIFYKHQYLPERNRDGLNFEDMVRQDLRLNALSSLFSGVDSNLKNNDDTDKEKTNQWTFEYVVLDPSAASDAKDVAVKLSAESSNWKNILKDKKLEAKKVGPIYLNERTKLLDGLATTQDYEKIFALTKDNPALTSPIERGGKFYVVRFIERKETQAPETQNPAGENFFYEWMSKLIAKAKVENFLSE